MQNPISRPAGFTLIEIMVVVGILAIIAAVAFPAYQAQALKSKRADGIAMLMEVAAKQERYLVDHSAYTSDMTLLGYSASPVASQKGYYQVSAVLSNSNLSYALTATAQPGQSADECGNLILSSSGQRTWSSSTATKCW